MNNDEGAQNNEMTRLMRELTEARAELARTGREVAEISHELSKALLTLKVSYDTLVVRLKPNEDQKKKIGFIKTSVLMADAASGRLERVCKRLHMGKDSEPNENH